MSNLKFRAWHKTDNNMFKVSSMNWNDEFNPRLVSIGLEDENGRWAGLIDNLNEIELMQWTGLTDKNGKDIYDGDILKFSDDGDLGKGRVRFSSGMFWIMCFDSLFDDMSLSEYAECPDYQIEIISNIYEDKELLGETN